MYIHNEQKLDKCYRYVLQLDSFEGTLIKEPRQLFRYKKKQIKFMTVSNCWEPLFRENKLCLPFIPKIGQPWAKHDFLHFQKVVKKKKWQKHWQKIFADSRALLYYIIYFCSPNCSTPFKKKWNALWICMSSFSKGHANLLYVIPVLVSAAEASTFRFSKSSRELKNVHGDSFHPLKWIHLVWNWFLASVVFRSTPVISIVEPGLRISSTPRFSGQLGPKPLAF